MAQNNTQFANWKNIDLYTKEFKEWIEKLFRKAQARMGHIEEDLAKVKRNAVSNYQLETTQVSSTQIDVVLMEKVRDESHGSFSISTQGLIEVSKWEEAGSHPIS